MFRKKNIDCFADDFLVQERQMLIFKKNDNVHY